MAGTALQRHLLITGAPGTGKTTVVRRIAERVTGAIDGFYTEEIRSHGVRHGFRIVTFDGDNNVIAHVDFPKGVQVSKYGVDVGAIDAAIEKAAASERGAQLYLIDEIGKMECFSTRFLRYMRQLLAGPKPVVATVAQRGDGFIAEVKQRGDSELWTLTRANRDEMLERIVAWLGERHGIIPLRACVPSQQPGIIGER